MTSGKIRVFVGKRACCALSGTSAVQGGRLKWLRVGVNMLTEEQFYDLLHEAKMEYDTTWWAPRDSCTIAELAALKRLIRQLESV